jgi:diguanylate cyclase (GGDEF)-like protein
MFNHLCWCLGTLTLGTHRTAHPFGGAVRYHNSPVADPQPLVVLAIVDAVLVGMFFLYRVLPWSRPGPWRLIWLIAAMTSVMFIASEAVALVTLGSAVALEHQIPLFGAIFAVSTGFILTYLSGQRVTERALTLAETDPLTQLGNVRGFDARLGDLHKRKESFALIYFDLDGFKSVNDQLGHPTGDAVLRAVAAIVQSSVRRGDVAARLGGDEFALLLPGAGEGASRAVADRMLSAIAADRTAGDRSITASVGIVTEGQRLSPTEVVRAADAAMYRAKAAGGGRIAMAGP